MANDLKYEDSPYLQQHKDNPVDWIAWKNSSFQKAQKENKLIFLSIGYSTCHWCHVMEHESFEDKEIADILNRDYISIKVDREEMPDVDKYYQDIYSLLNKGGGGWPLTIVMLPSKQVIFAATYIPKENRARMLGLKTLLNLIVKKFKNENEELQKSANSIEEAFKKYQNFKVEPVDISYEIVEKFIKSVDKNFDVFHKGLGVAPKFPHTSTFDLLLDIYSIFKDEDALSLSKQSLDAMSKGGIFDQIEGGFYRYSTDQMWQIPHFEKMLYTNAELLVSYSKLYSITKDEKYKQIVKKVVDAINERFLKDGLYYSASDADSQGKEGKYFVFDYTSAKNTLLENGFSKEDTQVVLDYYNITKEGNFEDNSTNPYIDEEKNIKDLEKANKVLKKLREKTPYPFIDNKILTSWNALFISGLFEAGYRVDTIYSKMAYESIDKLIDTMYANKKLYHQYLFGSTLKVEAVLEDYAFLVEALLKAYQSSFDDKYLVLAKNLAKEAEDIFYRDKSWYLGREIDTKAQFEDNSYKSAVATLINSMLSIALINEDRKEEEKIQNMISDITGNINQYPNAYAMALYTWLKNKKQEILLKIPLGKESEAREKLKELNYPFIFLTSSKQKHYQACQMELCFAISENIEEVIKQIKSRIKG